MKLIRHPKDFWTGILFIVSGGTACVLALGYAMGSASRMGPGYFPRVLGVLLALVGATLMLRSFRVEGAALSFRALRPLVIVLGSIVAFALALPWLGLALSTMLLVLVSSRAHHEHHVKESVVAAVALAAFVTIAFRYGLDVQIATWPPVLSR
jgi:hypothetical protein